MSKVHKLAEIQNLIQSSVKSRSLPQDLIYVIAEKPPISIEQRFHIYQDAYAIRLKESIRDDFPRIENVLQSEHYNYIIDIFIKKNPSRHANLAEYSELFVNYIEQNYTELTHLVYLDWFEILSSRAQEPKDQLSVTKIQQANYFMVKIKPSTFVKRIGLMNLLSYRQNGEVKQTSEVNVDIMSLLFYLKTARSIDDLVKFSIKQNVNFLSQELQKLIQNEIIYCCKSLQGASYV